MLISAEARPNVLNYGFGRNWFYIFQRVTGIFLFFFLFFHILNFRFGLIPGVNLTPIAGNADQAFSIVSREFHNGFILFFYILGVLATAWYLAYGFWLFAVDWGIIIGEKAQKFALYACIGLAIFFGSRRRERGGCIRKTMRSAARRALRSRREEQGGR
ncbi:MAG: hypothetical protein LC730_07120, partial [Acidobacteria bacterium]|nr:hypothetical protein [Acidobacteriota bacterium]